MKRARVLAGDGDTIRHFWGSELLYAPTDRGQDARHVGTLEPLWNLLDLTREGRGTDWDEQLSYSWQRADGPLAERATHAPRGNSLLEQASLTSKG